jgi:GNAT superfamily N-acetyltransferase
MLDKSIPYYNIIMMRKKGTELRENPLPEGFRFTCFQPGDEKEWARIESSVLEFSRQEEALTYFQKEYLPHGSDLSERCLFVSTESDRKIATTTAWWSSRNQIRVPSLHWIAVDPEFQGLGLGKALVGKALVASISLDGDRESFIHTQTWSYSAIGIYLKAGYSILREGSFARYPNDYMRALPYLKEKMGSRFSEARDTIALP